MSSRIFRFGFWFFMSFHVTSCMSVMYLCMYIRVCIYEIIISCPSFFPHVALYGDEALVWRGRVDGCVFPCPSCDDRDLPVCSVLYWLYHLSLVGVEVWGVESCVFCHTFVSCLSRISSTACRARGEFIVDIMLHPRLLLMERGRES